MAPRVALPVHLEPDLNWRVVGYATALSLITAGALSVVPAWRAFRSDLTTMLNLTSRTSTYRRSRMLQAAVVVQVALSVVALATAGLFLRSAASAAAVPAGFGDPNAMLLVTTDLSFSRLPAAGVLALGEDVLRRARLVPGAARAALASAIPLSFGPPPGVQARIDGYVPGPDESMSIPRVAVSDDYFEAMEIPLVAGRHFDTNDRADLDRVAIVNEAFAQRYWRGQNPIGRRLDQGDGWTVVVGVARDTRWESLTEPVRPLVFRPWTQLPPQTMTLHLRSPAANPLTLVEPLRRELFAAHADLPALEPRSLAQHMRAAFFVQTVGASALTVFGALAGLIAAVGLYGVLAQELAERRREVAVLIALGASPARAAVRYATPVLSLVATGSAVGLGLAVLTGVLVRRQLIGVSPADLPSLLGSAAVLVSVALAACGFPVWRAASANPARALATG
jgi:predicted permease